MMNREYMTAVQALLEHAHTVTEQGNRIGLDPALVALLSIAGLKIAEAVLILLTRHLTEDTEVESLVESRTNGGQS